MKNPLLRRLPKFVLLVGLMPLAAAATPKLSVSYYDPRTKTYKSAKTGGTPLKYGATR